jgi:hypothetical protein
MFLRGLLAMEREHLMTRELHDMYDKLDEGRKVAQAAV